MRHPVAIAAVRLPEASAPGACTQVCAGEFAVSRGVHASATDALTVALHFIINSVAAFTVALLVQDVRFHQSSLFVAAPSAPTPAALTMEPLTRCLPVGGPCW